jgi:hypothetical protein
MAPTLRHPEVLQRPQSPDDVFIFDLAALEAVPFSDQSLSIGDPRHET